MDKTLSVTSARQQLLKLTKDVRRRMDRVVLTNKGEAEAVLMSVGEYNSLKAAAELAMRPDVLRATEEGFEQIQEGLGRPLSDVFPIKAKAAELQQGAVQPHASERIPSSKRRLKIGSPGRSSVAEKIPAKPYRFHRKDHKTSAEIKAELKSPSKNSKVG